MEGDGDGTPLFNAVTGEQIAEASNTMTGPCVRPITSLVSLSAKTRQFGLTEEKGIFRCG